MAAVQTSSAFRTVRCRGCGSCREVTARQARRANLCPTCVNLPSFTVRDRDRNFWLKNHTDEELASIASEMMGKPVAASVFAAQRQSLTARTSRV